MCGHKWFPPEYPTAEDIKDDSLGIGQQEVTLDEILDTALSQYSELMKRRRDYLKHLFKDADVDQSGKLDFQEFKKVMSQLDKSENTSKTLHLFRQCVEDQEDDTIDIEVFCDVMQRNGLDRPEETRHEYLPADRRASITRLFRDADSSGTGKLTLEMAKSVLKHVDPHYFNTHSAAHAMQELVSSEEGIDLTTFCKIMWQTSPSGVHAETLTVQSPRSSGSEDES
mmetsp:Transcript_14795/g.23043  ORF Transcript_14795/g.23043 Transcript_14795/m.23043 type:complete len:226 (+) Transcript_14795:635-1312(+)